MGMKNRFIPDLNLLPLNQLDSSLCASSGNSRKEQFEVQERGEPIKVVIPFQIGTQIQDMGIGSDIIPNLAQFSREPY